MKSTNYENTLIEIAEDSTAKVGQIPPLRGEKKSIANYEYELISSNPYKYTSDEIKFKIHVIRFEIKMANQKAERDLYFSKGQPCFRASPLPKIYGWGVHFDGEGKIAIFGANSKEYSKLLKDESTTKVKAMRSKKAK